MEVLRAAGVSLDEAICLFDLFLVSRIVSDWSLMHGEDEEEEGGDFLFIFLERQVSKKFCEKNGQKQDI